MQNYQDSQETELQADERACNQIANLLASRKLRMRRRVSLGRGAGEWQQLLSRSTGPHE